MWVRRFFFHKGGKEKNKEDLKRIESKECFLLFFFLSFILPLYPFSLIQRKRKEKEK